MRFSTLIKNVNRSEATLALSATEVISAMKGSVQFALDLRQTKTHCSPEHGSNFKASNSSDAFRRASTTSALLVTAAKPRGSVEGWKCGRKESSPCLADLNVDSI